LYWRIVAMHHPAAGANRGKTSDAGGIAGSRLAAMPDELTGTAFMPG
jgi:hypothetical protein